MTVDAALSGLFAGSLLAAMACARRRPGFVPVAGAVAVLGALHAARLVATPILDVSPVPYTGRALWAMRAEVAALAAWPWVTAILCVVVLKDEGPAVADEPFPRSLSPGSRHLVGAGLRSAPQLPGETANPDAVSREHRHRAPAQPTALPSRWQVPALAGGAILASVALAASYPALRGAALLAWYPRSRVAALAVVAVVVWGRLRVERIGSAHEIVRRRDLGGSARREPAEVRVALPGLPAGGRENAENECGEHAPQLAPSRRPLQGPEIPALVLAAEQLAQLVLWQAGPWRLSEAWPAVEVVSLAGYGALLVVLVGMAYRLRARS